MAKTLKWHRVYNTNPNGNADYVAHGASQNYLVARYSYGWELFYMTHSTRHAIQAGSGPWESLKDAKAKAQELENG